MEFFAGWSGVRRCVRRFLGEGRAGATALTAAVVTVMAVGATALIIDHVWVVDQRDTLKGGANAAGVAATLEMRRILANDPAISDDDLKAALQPVGRRYVVLNLQHLSGDRYDRALETLVVEVQPDRSQGTVNVTAQADLGGFLLASRLALLSGVKQLEFIATESRTESVTNPVEVVLAIDVSGSMARDLDGSWRRNSSNSRMNIVKQAASELVAILNPNETNRVAVGVVPWHFVVRLDEVMREDWERKGWAAYPRSRHYAATYDCRPEPGCRSMAADQNLPAQGGSKWNGCLDEHRVSAAGHADFVPTADSLDPPSDTAFALAFYPASYGIGYQCMSSPLPSNYELQSCYTAKSAPDGKTQFPRPAQYGCDEDSPSVLPLSSERERIDAAIKGLSPIGPKTHSALGVLWGQRLLSHSWKGVWGGDVHPVDEGAKGNAAVRKVIVLLTDGEDTQCRETGDPACTRGGGVERTDACSLAKRHGTEIFVIAAMEPEEVSRGLAETLRACSSEADNPEGSYVFLDNVDAETLKAAFADVANQLVTVRRVH